MGSKQPRSSLITQTMLKDDKSRDRFGWNDLSLIIEEKEHQSEDEYNTLIVENFNNNTINQVIEEEIEIVEEYSDEENISLISS